MARAIRSTVNLSNVEENRCYSWFIDWNKVWKCSKCLSCGWRLKWVSSNWLLYRSFGAMEARPPAKTDPTCWRKKRAFTQRYLETVWPRKYWSDGPQSFDGPRSFVHYKLPCGSLSPKAPRKAWATWAPESGRKSKSNLEKATAATPRVVPQAEKAEAPPEHDSQMWLRKLPSVPSFHSCKANTSCSEDMLMKDKRRQEVYGKMTQIGSFQLVLAQVEATGRFARPLTSWNPNGLPWKSGNCWGFCGVSNQCFTHYSTGRYRSMK